MKIFILILVYITLAGAKYRYSTPECSCGYGGLCLISESGQRLDSPCELCSTISGGFYDQDCHTITDHCRARPCQRGTCVRTFGAYFCECPPGYVGQKCEIEALDFSTRNIQTKLYAYYQVQPGREETKQFTIIVDPVDINGVRTVQPNAEVKIIIELSNGATSFPDMNHDFVSRNVKEECFATQESYPSVKDARVCQFLPDGNVRAFTFDPTVYSTSSEPQYEIYLPQYGVVVGYVGKVTVAVVLTELDKIPKILHFNTYTVFTYSLFRPHNKCFMDLMFYGCSVNRTLPTTYVRQSNIKISSAIPVARCRGGFVYKKTWYRQGLYEYKDINSYLSTKIRVGEWDDLKDDLPVAIPELNDRVNLAFDPMYFQLGLNMLRFEISLRGDPPHIGGTSPIRKIAQCWINIAPGPMSVHVKGGIYRTASCYQPLILHFVSTNPSIMISDLTFDLSCDHKDDEECEISSTEEIMTTIVKSISTVRSSSVTNMNWAHYFCGNIDNLSFSLFFNEMGFQNVVANDLVHILHESPSTCRPASRLSGLEPSGWQPWGRGILIVPFLKKLHTPCNTRYEFFMRASHDYFPELTQNLSIVVFFKETTRLISVECFFNCHPIEPHEKTIWIAHTDPYDPEPIKWRVIWKRRNITGRSVEVEALSPMGASRIFMLNKCAMCETTNYSDTVSFRASTCCGAYSQSTYVVDNFNNRANEFQLVWAENSYQFVETPRAYPYPFSPERYEVYQIQPPSQDWAIYIETSDINDIRFRPVTPTVKLCIHNGWSSVACGPETVVERPYKPVTNTIEDLIALRRAGNFRSFLGTVDENLYDDLTNGTASPNQLRWTYSEEYRLRVIELVTTVDAETLHMSDIAFIISITTKIFYTKLGNAHEKLIPFEDVEIGENYVDFHNWMETRTLSLQLLSRCFRLPAETNDLKTWKEVRDFLKHGLRAWSLAWEANRLGVVMQRSFDPLKYDYFHGEMNCERLKHQQLSYSSMTWLLKTMIKRIPFYYGVEVFGRSDSTVWVVKCLYNGIRHHLDEQNNRKWGRVDASEPPEEKDHWMSKLLVELPDQQTQLDSLQVTLAIVVVKEPWHTLALSPTVYLEMRTKSSSLILHFQNATYYVQLPILKTQNLAPQFKLSTINDHGDEYQYDAFKVVLPVPFDKFAVVIIVRAQIEYFKCIVNFDRVPSYEETYSELPENCTEIEKSVYQCTHIVHTTFAENGTSNLFYMGVIIGSSEGSTVSFHFRTRLNMCVITRTYHPWITPALCKVVEHPIPLFNSTHNSSADLVRCECETLGIVTAFSREVRFAKVLTGLRIIYSARRLSTIKWAIGISIIFALILLAVLSVRKDILRARKENLSHFSDNNPNYAFKYIIGVYTSTSLFAGTCSSVAIKLIGTNASSDVHLLKAEPKKTLTSGSDNWYVMTTKESLGNIEVLYLWLNYRWMSAWKCSHIWIYDVENSHWFLARVDKWLDVKSSDDEASRLLKVEVVSRNPNADRPVRLADLSKIALKEIRNKHFLFSYLFLHQRSIYDFKGIGSLLVLKTILIVSMCWLLFRAPMFFQLISGTLTRNVGILTKASHHILIAFLISMIARALTVPFIFFYRSIYVANAFQRKFTNPLDSYIRSSQVLVWESFRQWSNPFITHERTPKKSITRSDLERKRLSSKHRTSRMSRFSAFSTPSRHTSKGEYGSQILHPSARSIIWNKVKYSIFGPSQFLCINADMNTFRTRVQDKQKKTRIVTYVVVSLIFTSALISTWITDLHRASACYRILSERQCVVQVVVFFVFALVLDVIIWEPLVIFINTFCMVLFTKTTNKEKMFWSQEGRVQLNRSTLINHEKYLKTTTHKDYKPLFTEEIEKLRRAKLWISIVRHFTYHSILIGTILLTLLFISNKNTSIKYFSNRYTLEELSSGCHRYLGRETAVKISEVVDMETAINFASYYVSWNNKWPNLKPMRHGDHWALDRKYKHLGDVHIVVLVVRGDSRLSMYLPLKKYFPPALGYLTQRTQLVDDFTFRKRLFQYRELSDDFIFGKSKRQYPYRGQVLSLTTNDFLEFYTQYRFILSRLEKDMGNGTMRALIVTNNFVNMFAKIITKVDMLTEFLPSGVVLPKIVVNSVSADTDNHTGKYLFWLIALIIVLTIFNAFTVSDVGLVRYLTTPHHVLSFMVLLASVWLTIMFTVQTLNTSSNHLLVNEDPHYSCLRRAEEENWSVLLFLSLALLEVGLSIRRLLGIECLSGPFFNCVLPCIAAFLYCWVLIELASVYTLGTVVKGLTFVQASLPEEDMKRPLNLSKAMMVLFFMFSLKCICGGFMAQYLVEPCDYGTRAGKTIARLTNKPTPPPSKIPSFRHYRPINDDDVQRSEQAADNTGTNQQPNETDARHAKFLFFM